MTTIYDVGGGVNPIDTKLHVHPWCLSAITVQRRIQYFSEKGGTNIKGEGAILLLPAETKFWPR